MNIRYKMNGKLADYPNVKVSYVWIAPNWNRMSWYHVPVAFILACIVSAGLNLMNLYNGRDLNKLNEIIDDLNKKDKK